MYCMTVLDFITATLQANTTGCTFPISNKFYGRVDSLRSVLRRGTGKERNERSSSLLGGRQRKKTARLSLRVRYTSRGARRGLLLHSVSVEWENGTPWKLQQSTDSSSMCCIFSNKVFHLTDTMSNKAAARQLALTFLRLLRAPTAAPFHLISWQNRGHSTRSRVQAQDADNRFIFVWIASSSWIAF